MTSPQSRNATCATCRHWEALPAQLSARAGVEGGVGACHARPPATSYTFPRTAGADWCGWQEQQPKPASTVTAPGRKR